MILKYFVLLIGFLFVITSTQAQTVQDTSVVRIKTIHKKKIWGEITKEDSFAIEILTEKKEEITIPKSDIKSRKEVSIKQIKDGKYWFNNPQPTHYFISSSGYGLKKGEGYYRNVDLFINSFSYGLTDNVSLGGGIAPLSILANGALSPTFVFATAKLSIPIKEKINISGGVFLMTNLDENTGGVGTVYGVSTFGTRDNNISVGLSYGFAENKLIKYPLLNIGGIVRVTRTMSLIAELHSIGIRRAGMLLAFGGRSIIKRASLDYGIIIPVVENVGTLPIPWLGFTIPFGKTK